MNSLQKQYNSFIESICSQFGCTDAIHPLQEGFSALCEECDPCTESIIGKAIGGAALAGALAAGSMNTTGSLGDTIRHDRSCGSLIDERTPVKTGKYDNKTAQDNLSVIAANLSNQLLTTRTYDGVRLAKELDKYRIKADSGNAPYEELAVRIGQAHKLLNSIKSGKCADGKTYTDIDRMCSFGGCGW